MLKAFVQCAYFAHLAESFASWKMVVAIQISVSYHICKNDSQNRQATFSKDFFTFKLRNKDLWKMSLDSRKQRAGSYLCAALHTTDEMSYIMHHTTVFQNQKSFFVSDQNKLAEVKKKTWFFNLGPSGKWKNF